uniref:Enoyl reductase (ER) domain-containing protein n=1 Tax=Ditylum brightwellii TaxID=49249 RepID=A0A7S4T8M2_9STRA
MGKSAKKSERFQEGDRVAALTRTGGNARYANVPISRLVRVPGSVDSAEAACIVTTFATAYQVLHRARPDSETHSLEGKHVLITGGSGPTGQAMIQLAHLAGASKVYSTALEKYHGMLRHLGAVPLPLTTKDWLPEVEGEMDFVADSLCQDDFASPHAALKKGGHLVVMGVSAINNTESRGMFGQPVSAKLAMFKARNVMSNTTVFDLWESFERKPEVYKRDLEYLLTLLEKEKIKPNLAGRVPLYDVPEAQKKIQEGKIRGMLVCKPWK